MKVIIKKRKPTQCLKSVLYPSLPPFFITAIIPIKIWSQLYFCLTFPKYTYIPVLNYKVPNYGTFYLFFLSLFIINNMLKIYFRLWEIVEFYKDFEFLCQFKQVSLLCTSCFPVPFPLIQELNCYIDAFSF